MCGTQRHDSNELIAAFLQEKRQNHKIVSMRENPVTDTQNIIIVAFLWYRGTEVWTLPQTKLHPHLTDDFQVYSVFSSRCF